MITCANCLQALQPYIDRELSDADVAQVRLHLEACRGCLHLYEFEESVRRLVRVRCREQQAPDGLRARIEACLAAERQRRAQPRARLSR
ncbi:MAG: mycothiol system anti-sigma-R factor [Chloroflexota bacterium]|nr:mycothiol system anti-sigma-R factor [Chloroflexota bacterium]